MEEYLGFDLPVKFAFSLLLVTGMLGCSDLCGVERISEIISPDGDYVADVFERNCGATTPYVRVVGLRKADSPFSENDHDDWVFTIHGKSDVRARWASNDGLNISFTRTGDDPMQRVQWRTVSITYK